MASLLLAADAFIAIWVLFSTGQAPSGVVRWMVPVAALPWGLPADRTLAIALAVLALVAGIVALARVRAAPALLGVVGAGTVALLAAGAIKTATAVDGRFLGLEYDARFAFGSLVLLLLGLLVAAGAVGISRQVTTIAAVAALVLALGAGVLGSATSHYTAFHEAMTFNYDPAGSAPSCDGSDADLCGDSPAYNDTYDDSSSNSYGDNVGGDTSSDNGPSGSTSPDEVSSLFPTGAAWATCEAGTPVATVETNNFKIVICSGGAGGYTYNAVRISDGASLSLTATYADDAFTATASSGTTYVVSPTELRIYDPSHELEQVDAVTNSPNDNSTTGGATQADLVAELENLIETSHDGRATVVSLSNDVTGTSCIDSTSAADRIASVESNRSQMLDAGRTLQAEASDANGAVQNAVDLFVTSMQDSLAADQAFSTWISSTYSAYADGDCTGSLTTHGDPAYEQFLDSSKAASTDKANLARAFDPLAATDDLKSDWTGDDI